MSHEFTTLAACFLPSSTPSLDAKPAMGIDTPSLGVHPGMGMGMGTGTRLGAWPSA